MNWQKWKKADLAACMELVEEFFLFTDEDVGSVEDFRKFLVGRGKWDDKVLGSAFKRIDAEEEAGKVKEKVRRGANQNKLNARNRKAWMFEQTHKHLSEDSRLDLLDALFKANEEMQAKHKGKKGWKKYKISSLPKLKKEYRAWESRFKNSRKTDRA